MHANEADKFCESIHNIEIVRTHIHKKICSLMKFIVTWTTLPPAKIEVQTKKFLYKEDRKS